MKKWIAVLVTVPLLGACATVKPEQTSLWGYKKNPNMSEALNVATAVGLSNDSLTGSLIKDNKAPMVRKSYKPSAARKIGTVATVAGAAAEGILTAGSAALDVASILQPTNIDVPRNDDWAWIFLPVDKASNLKNAAAYTTKAMKKAMYSALAKQGLHRGPVLTIDLGAIAGKVSIPTIIGGKCDNKAFVCAAGTYISTSPYLFQQFWGTGGALLRNAPYFAPNKKVWFFRQTSAIGFDGYIKEKKSKTYDRLINPHANMPLNYDKFWRDVTKGLPWLWIYHGTKYAPVGPVIYHHGHVLRFIKPAAAAQQTAAK